MEYLSTTADVKVSYSVHYLTRTARTQKTTAACNATAASSSQIVCLGAFSGFKMLEPGGNMSPRMGEWKVAEWRYETRRSAMSISTPAERIEPVLTWIQAQRDAALADLQRFCRQPSISAQGQGMREMAQLVAESLRRLGAETSLVPTQGFPVGVGRLAGESTRRLAIYDHYDAQPPEPLEAWSMLPFEAAIRDGRLYARGVADNKGNLVARLWAVRAWREVHGAMPCGVTFLVEGEEEIGSPGLGEISRAHQDWLQADSCLWEAGTRNEQDSITITAGLKGLLSVELRVQSVAYDLHSSNAPLAPNA